jgi:hypothetical protein
MKIMYDLESYHRIYDASESNRLFVPILEKIFVPSEQSNALTGNNPNGVELFIQKHWKSVGFDGCAWNGTTDYIPSNLPKTAVQPDRNGTWDRMRPLFIALVEMGVDEIIHMNPFELEDTQNLGENGAVTSVPMARATAAAQYPKGPVGIFNWGCMFSRHGNWGLFGDVDSISILGGEPTFIDRVIELAGGEDFLKAEFDNAWIDTYAISPPPNHDWTFACYDCIGWSVPDIIRNLEPGQSLDRSHLSWINDVPAKGTE